MRLKKYKVGMRAFKTALATSLAIFICQIFNITNASFAGVEAIICMQSNVYSSLQIVRNRIIATLMGAFIAIFFVYFKMQNPIAVFLGICIIIYLCNLFNFLNSIVLASIVFLMIILYHDTTISFFEYSIQRLFISFIGQGVGFGINYLIYPPKVEKTLHSMYKSSFNDCMESFKNILKKKSFDSNLLIEDIHKLNDQFNLIEQNTKIRITEHLNTKDIYSLNAKFYLLISLLKELSEVEYIPAIYRANKDKIKKVLDLDVYEDKVYMENTFEKVYNYELTKAFSLINDIKKSIEKLKEKKV